MIFKVGDRVVVKKKKVYLASFNDKSINRCLENLVGEHGTIKEVCYRDKDRPEDLFSRVYVVLDKDRLIDTYWIFETNAVRRLKDSERT